MSTYATVRLTTDTQVLTENEREMLPLLVDAAKEMDQVFWLQAFQAPEPFLSNIADPKLRQFAAINYGPWDRLQDNRPFLPGYGPKPKGAGFYPQDLSTEVFDAYLAQHPEQAESLKSMYSVVRRDGDRFIAVPYHEAYREYFERAAKKLEAAAQLAPQPALAKYLRARAQSLRNDDYRTSDLLWMDMKDNRLDIVIGPIENYEDQLYGRKAACEAYVLVKDLDWSQKLTRYVALLPGLQAGLPVDEAYRQEKPGLGSDLNAYDVIYYAGDCNAGSKTIAINLPNDEQVQLQKGTRRLQLKNAMQAKYDKILIPIADRLMDPEQRAHVKFNAFFSNTMFHEVAHGLGIKYTVESKQSVREVLRDLASGLEEGKADILGLHMVTVLLEQGELTEGELADYYVTFLAGIIRSVRFGASSAHGRANVVCFNYFREQKAFTRSENGRYRVELSAMKDAVRSLSRDILVLQGNGDYKAAQAFVAKYGELPSDLQADLERLNQFGIPVDIVFEQ